MSRPNAALSGRAPKKGTVWALTEAGSGVLTRCRQIWQRCHFRLRIGMPCWSGRRPAKLLELPPQ